METNSMPINWNAGLSILYLRCLGRRHTAPLRRSRALSILYLRCNVFVSVFSFWHGFCCPFNSLFEMQLPEMSARPRQLSCLTFNSLFEMHFAQTFVVGLLQQLIFQFSI